MPDQPWGTRWRCGRQMIWHEATCQLKVTDALDGLVVQMPEKQI